MPDRPDFVCCPVCRGTVFHPVMAKRADGTKVETGQYACANCTVICLDPVALTRAFEDRPRSARRSVDATPAIQAWGKINQRKRDRG